MNILLININPVVSRLIMLCLHDNPTLLEEVENVSGLKSDRYDLVFVDDSSYDKSVEDFFKNIEVGKKIFLSASMPSLELIESFDAIVEKPFLPSQIRDILREVTQTVNMKSAVKRTEILNSNEINKIKEILQENIDDDSVVDDEDNYEARKIEVITEHLEADGLDIIEENDIVNVLSHKSEKIENKKKKKFKKKYKKSLNNINTVEEALLFAIKNMQTKEIKKLLKDAEVTITIKFKDDK